MSTHPMPRSATPAGIPCTSRARTSSCFVDIQRAEPFDSAPCSAAVVTDDDPVPIALLPNEEEPSGQGVQAARAVKRQLPSQA